MKSKILVLLLSLTVILGLCSATVSAADTASITLTVSGAESVPQAAALTVSDRDGDGTLTINDAIICAHETYYAGGADGFATVDSDYGPMITRLWGVENGGSYGYYLNHAMSMGLSDPIADGDTLDVFIYQDTTAYSDTYCYFEVGAVSADSAALTLMGAGYDENWNTVFSPIAGATVYVDGVAAAVTDANGQVTVPVSGGRHVVTASSDTMTLVTPAVAIESTAADTSDCGIVAAAVVMVLAAGVVLTKKH